MVDTRGRPGEMKDHVHLSNSKLKTSTFLLFYIFPFTLLVLKGHHNYSGSAIASRLPVLSYLEPRRGFNQVQ